MKIGVLALQGGFSKHLEKLQEIGVEAIPIRYGHELETTDGLILPGGESTAITRLLETSDLKQPLLEWKKPIFATCAGTILLAKWGRLDCAIARNAYGRQSDSFTAQLKVEMGMGSHFCEGIFIRAPKIVALLSNEVEILAQHQGQPVFVRQNQLLAATFHPELTQETKIHRFFSEVCHEFKRENGSAVCHSK